MTKKIRLFLMLLTMTFALLSLTACYSGDETFDPEANGYDIAVTYDCLGGTIAAKEVRTLYCKPNDLLPEPKGETGIEKPIRKDYTCDGWFTAFSGTRDKPTFAETNRWSFETDRASSAMTLYAKWVKKINVEWWVPQESKPFFTITYNSDTLIRKLSDVLDPKKAGYSFTGRYFVDEQLSMPWDFETMKTPLESETPVKIYAKMIEGEYLPLRTVSSLKYIDATKNYILMNDIDLNGDIWKPIENYVGKFNGNGNTIKNFNIKIDTRMKKSYGFFASATNAKIFDLNMSGATVVLSGSGFAQEQTYAILVGSANGSTTITNCTISGSVEKGNNPLLISGKVVGFKQPTVVLTNIDDSGVNFT